MTYFRVSTDRQGETGLGIEAQRDAVAAYLAHSGGDVLAEFVEVESGKRDDRPELMAALALCRRKRATLLIAKLDRLGRKVRFIAGLMEAGVEFVATDNPHATPLLIHLLAAFAEHERNMISSRTRAALQAAKARGVVLGKHGVVLAAENRREALRNAVALSPHLADARRAGASTYAAVAAYLNERGVACPRGGKWHATSIRRLDGRLDQARLGRE